MRPPEVPEPRPSSRSRRFHRCAAGLVRPPVVLGVCRARPAPCGVLPSWNPAGSQGVPGFRPYLAKAKARTSANPSPDLEANIALAADASVRQALEIPLHPPGWFTAGSDPPFSRSCLFSLLHQTLLTAAPSSDRQWPPLHHTETPLACPGAGDRAVRPVSQGQERARVAAEPHTGRRPPRPGTRDPDGEGADQEADSGPKEAARPRAARGSGESPPTRGDPRRCTLVRGAQSPQCSGTVQRAPLLFAEVSF